MAATTLRQTPLTCSGHTRPVVDLSFSDVTLYGYFLISASKDGNPMLRQGDTGDWIGTFVGHKGAVWSATLNKTADIAATGAADFTARVWNAQTGDEVHSFSHKHIVKAVNFSSDGKKLLTGSNEKILRIFDLDKPESDPVSFQGHTSNIKNAIWSKDDRKIFSASDDKTVRVWDAVNQTEVAKLDFTQAVTSLELSADGDVFVVTHGKTIDFWDANSFEKLKYFDAPTNGNGVINSACLHPDKQCFVAGGDDFKIYKMDYKDGTVQESYKGHFGPVHCVQFSPDGELYASGSEDGTLRLWQTTVGKTYGLWRWAAP